MAMTVIVPVDTTDATLTASNVPEDDYPEWDAMDDYIIGDYVISTTTHTIYRALVANGASSTVVNPDTEAAEFADPTVIDPATQYWSTINATNRWQLFDEKPSVQCSNPTSIDVTITPNAVIDGIGLFRLDAASVQIIMTDPVDGVVYDETTGLSDNSGIDSWYAYYFEPIDELSDVAFLSLPPYASASIRVIISRTGGTAYCGQLVLGRKRDLGETTTAQTNFTGVDFSTVQQDIFGDLYTVKRASTRLNKYRVWTNTTRLQAIARIMRELRGGTAAVWVGTEDERLATLNYGFWRDYRVDYEDAVAQVAYMTIEVQGIV